MNRKDVKKMADNGNIDGLIQMLTHDDWEVSDEAVYLLGKMGNKMAIEPLHKLLKWNWDKYGEAGGGMRGEIRNSLEKLGYIFKNDDDKFGPW